MRRIFILIQVITLTFRCMAFVPQEVVAFASRKVSHPSHDYFSSTRTPHPSTPSTSSKPITSTTSLQSWFSRYRSSSPSYDQRRRIRQEISNLEDEDFLTADLKPKLLVHERDFFRQSTRMAAWDEYVLVSILCTSISYNALSGFALNADHVGIFVYEVLLKSAVQLVAGLAVLCGLYSTMVFSLSILYGKTALGLELDGQYDEFFAKTEEIRDRAFLAFSLSLAFFALLVVLVLAEDLPLVMNMPIGSVMIFTLWGGYKDWQKLVDSGEEIYDFLDD